MDSESERMRATSGKSTRMETLYVFCRTAVSAVGVPVWADYTFVAVRYAFVAERPCSDFECE